MKNSKGFTLIEGLLILVIFGIVAGTGYYVWNSRQQTNKDLNTAQNETSAVKVSKNASKNTVTQTATSSNDQTQNSYNPKFSYTKPNGWKVSSETPGLYTYTYLASPDFKVIPPGEQECSSFDGMRFTIASTNTGIDPNIVDKMLASDYSSIFQKDIKESKLGGQKAVEYVGTPGECGWSLTTITVYNGYSIQISTQLGDENAISTYRTAYDNLVASFKFL